MFPWQPLLKSKKKELNISVHFHNISFWTSVLEHDRSSGVVTLMFLFELIAKIKIQ